MISSRIPITMSSIDMRAESQQILERIDERFLAAVHALLKTYEHQGGVAVTGDEKIVSYDVVTGRPRTASEFTEILDGEVAAIRRGDFTTFEDFQKESAQWGQRTK